MTDLPPGWVKATLGEIAETSLGKMLDRKNGSGRHLRPYLRNVNVQWGRIDESDVLTMDIPPDQEERYGLRRGDLLVCEGGEVGRCAIWSGSDQYMGYQKALHRVRPLGGIDPRYVRYLLEHLSLRKVLLAYSSGSTIKHLPQEQLRVLPVPVPPLAEQRRIIAVVESYLTRIDVAESLARKVVVRSEHLKKAEVHRCFRGVDSAASGYSQAKLSDVAVIMGGQTPPRISDYLEASPRGGGVPFVRVGDMNSGDGVYVNSSRAYVVDEFLEKGALRRWPAGTLIIPKRGGAISTDKKRILSCEAVLDLNVMAVKPDDRVSSAYLWCWFQQVKLASLADGSNVPQINFGDLAGLTVPVPPLSVQAEIAERIMGIFEGADRLSSQVSEASSRRLRASLLAEAFAGRLVPQDPNDEPASELLARIRAERGAALPKQKARSRPTKKELPAPPTRVTGDDYQQEALPL